MATQKDKFLKGCADRTRQREEGLEDLGLHGAVRGVRLQQVALRGLRLAGLPDRLPQGQLPGLLHGRPAHLGAREHGQDGAVHRRVPRDGDRGAPPGLQPVGDVSSRSWARTFASGWPRSRTWARARWRRSSPPARAAGPVQVDVRVLRARRPAGGEPPGGGELHQERLLRLAGEAARLVDGGHRPRHGGGPEAAARPRAGPGQPARHAGRGGAGSPRAPERLPDVARLGGGRAPRLREGVAGLLHHRPPARALPGGAGAVGQRHRGHAGPAGREGGDGRRDRDRACAS